MLWKFTKRLHQQGHTIVLTTHYLEEAEALCDYIAILNQGQVIALDKKQTLLAHYPYRLLHLHLTCPSVTLPIHLQDKIVSLTDDKLVLRLHREHDSIGALLESLRVVGIQFTDLHTEEPGLEEVFIRLIHKT
jgi:ABC-2 type transport system ATP-binding protein